MNNNYLINWEERAKAAEAACAAFRYAIQRHQDDWGINYFCSEEFKSALSSNAGRSYVSLNSDLIKDLESCLKMALKANVSGLVMTYQGTRMTTHAAITQVLATLDKARQAAGLKESAAR